MSDYVKATDFAAKDALLTGNPSKLVKGTELGAEFDAIVTAIATKLDASGDIDLAVADGGTGASTAADARTNLAVLGTAGGTMTGQLAASAGSAAAPSLTTAGDLNTGIYFPAADTISLSTGGSEAFRLESGLAGAYFTGAYVGAKYLRVYNSDATIGSSSTIYADSDSGLIQLNISNTASGGGAANISTASGGYSIYTANATNLSFGSNSVLHLVIDATGNVTKNNATGGIGYGAGAGGTVTQLTSKATGVTLNTPTGEITTHNAALNGGVTVSFILTNSVISATDVLVINHVSGGTIGYYTFNAQCAAGSATINVHNLGPSNLIEALVLRFALIRGATS